MSSFRLSYCRPSHLVYVPVWQLIDLNHFGFSPNVHTRFVLAREKFKDTLVFIWISNIICRVWTWRYTCSYFKFLFYLILFFCFIIPQTPRFPPLLEEILRFSRNFLYDLFFKGFFPQFFEFTYTLNLLFMERFIKKPNEQTRILMIFLFLFRFL